MSYAPDRPPPPGSLPDAQATQAPTPAARDRVVEVLTRQYAEDQIADADLQAQLDRVYHATTLAELDAVLAGSPVAPSAVPSTQVVALFSGQEQRFTGALPHRLEIRARFGYAEIDLRNANFLPGVTEVDIRSFCGYVQIWLPRGVRVESTGRALFGFFALKGGHESAREDAPVVRISGRAMFGFAECYRSAAAGGEPGTSVTPTR